MKKKNQRKSDGNHFTINYLKYILIIILIIITSFVFSNSLNNDFTNYDDELYVINNNYIKDVSFKGIENIFKSFTKDELPLTLLSLALNFKFSGLNPYSYHFINLIFHLLNVLLVFQLVIILTKKLNIAFIASLLFGIHPFRVESVSWVTERKDVLYAFFFLLSLLSYIRYIKNNYDIKYYFLSILLFIFSILSKFAALTLPLIILLTDYYFERKPGIKLISEKIIFFIIPVITGLFHFYNKEIAQINEMLVINFPFFDRIFMGSYALIFYLFNSVIPLKLTLIHPYPAKINNMLPVEYYLSIIFTLAILAGLFIIIKNYLFKNRLLIYGLFFFLISISIVLHIAPMGGNIVVGERYTYIAYIGLFTIIGYFFDLILNKKIINKYRYMIYFFSAAYIIVFCDITYQRNKVWHDSITLWTDVINKNPDIYFSYNKRADKYLKLGKYEEAMNDLTVSLTLNPDFSETYNLRGTSKAYLKDYKGALDDYTNAIRLNSTYSEAYKNRGLTKLYLGDLRGSIEDLDRSLAYNKNYPEAYNYRGYAKCLLKDYRNGINDFNVAISLNDTYLEAYSNRGNAKAFMNDYTGSVADYTKVIELNPKDNAAYANRGNSELNLKNLESACRDWQISASLGNELANKMFNRYCNGK